MVKKSPSHIKIIAQNKKARHDYHILDVYEAGIVLKGSEVKSLRKGQCQLKDSYVHAHKQELFLRGMHISPYLQSSYNNHTPERTRKLLMHKRQIHRLDTLIRQKGLTIVPLKIYFKVAKIKVEIATVKGKKLYDQRETLKKRDMERRAALALKRR